MADLQYFEPINNYIYLYHLDKFFIIPTYPEQLQDSSQANFSEESILGRSAPIYSFSNSGPRTLNVTLKMHRELTSQVNGQADDIVDELTNALQAAVVPDYQIGSKMVNPPLVAVSFGSDVYIKGIIRGAVTITRDLPIIMDDKFAIINIGFSVTETTPFSGRDLLKVGSWRLAGRTNFSNTSNGLIKSRSTGIQQ